MVGKGECGGRETRENAKGVVRREFDKRMSKCKEGLVPQKGLKQ